MRSDFRLGDWVVQPSQCRLSRGDRTVQVRAKVMDLLAYLAGRPGEVVSKERLLDDVWGSQAVSESALTRTVTELRQALGDSADTAQFLETIPKRGYRLIGPVEPLPGMTAVPVASPAEHPAAWMRLAVLIAAVAVVAGVSWWGWQRSQNPGTAVRLAVLPFESIGGSTDHEYLADGLAEDIIVSLGMIDPGHLTVIGRTSTLQYRHTTKSLKEIGAELTADYLVESTIRTEGERLKITSKLVRVADQAMVWSQPYERELSGILGLQLEVSTAIAEQIRQRIPSGTRASIERRQPRNADAYNLYIRGRALWMQRNPGSNQRAVQLFKEAIGRDAGYALAWSGLADAYSASPVNADMEPSMVRRPAREAVDQAVRTAPDLAEVQASQGLLSFWLEWSWPAAETAARRATAQNSSHATAHLVLGNVLSHSGRHDEARQEMRRARAVDPFDPMMFAGSSQHAFHAGDYAGALAYARQAIGIDPEFWVGYMQLGQALERTGQIDPALEALATAERLSGGNSKPVSLKGYILAKAGRTHEARAVLDGLVARSRDRYVPMYAVALVHAGLGDGDAMFQALEAARNAGDVHLVFLPVDPKWAPYRADPRFKTLLDQSVLRRRD